MRQKKTRKVKKRRITCISYISVIYIKYLFLFQAKTFSLTTEMRSENFGHLWLKQNIYSKRFEGYVAAEDNF